MSTNTTPDQPAYRTAVLRRLLGVSLSWRHPLASIEALIDPVALIGVLWLLLLYYGEDSDPIWWAVSALIYILTFPTPAWLRVSFGTMLRALVSGWLVFIALLIGSSEIISALTDLPVIIAVPVLRDWLWIAPLLQLSLHVLMRLLVPMINDPDSIERVAVIAGAGEAAVRMADHLRSNPYGMTRIAGCFDDRHGERADIGLPLLGDLADLPAWIEEGKANVVYITLPLVAQSRISNLLETLRSTNAQVYYMPDTLVTDLLRGWRDLLGDAPVVAMLESPFDSIAGVVKRIIDIVGAAILFVITLPLLLVLAVMVKLASRGPAFMVQHRFGLDGGEILLYALRATEPGPKESELGDTAPANNAFGQFLRTTELERLPRLINVLQGRLSLVGPRPHSRSHNEIYRRIVKGHLIRHQVRCGLTGWAQINGIRGGIKTLDHMKARVNHDFEYLRHWSLRLDLRIMLRSIVGYLSPLR
ncbi:MAG TPA: sugar transferase [Rhodocyclaceae bacterium]|jgi:putative colanic acid biosynthesis UDP-glucose lipid carrier transferase|nr:sugar transferase [Rhodocyclaceae bacterium]